MLGYLVRRLAMTIPTLLLVAITVFALVRLIPGDPVQVMLGDSADPAQVEQLRRQMGLDQSIPVQFGYWLAKVAVGDFGHSITNGLAVLPLILERFPVSDNFGQALAFIVLPIATLAMIEIGALTRMSRASSIEVLRLEYVTHARAKGAPEWRVLGRHVLPNAFAPTWTLIGLILGHLL